MHWLLELRTNENTIENMWRTNKDFQAENHVVTSEVKHGNRSGGDPGGGAGQDSEVTLDVQEEEAEVLEDSSGKAHDEKR